MARRYFIHKSWGQAAHYVRRCGDREQEVVDWNSKLPVRRQRNNKKLQK